MFFLPSLRGDFSFFFYCSLIHGNLLATYTPLFKYYLNTVYLLLFWDWISKGEKCMDEFWTKFISSRLHILTTDIYNLKSGVWEKKKDPCTSQRSSRHWYQLDLLFFFFWYVTRSIGETNKTCYRSMARPQRMFWFNDVFSQTDNHTLGLLIFLSACHTRSTMPIYSEIGPPNHSQMLTAQQVLMPLLP